MLEVTRNPDKRPGRSMYTMVPSSTLLALIFPVSTGKIRAKGCSAIETFKFMIGIDVGIYTINALFSINNFNIASFDTEFSREIPQCVGMLCFFSELCVYCELEKQCNFRSFAERRFRFCTKKRMFGWSFCNIPARKKVC